MPVGSFDFMVSENLFYIRQSLVSESSVFALYPTNSRFNHSCAPNTNASDNVDDTKEMFATNDIDSEYGSLQWILVDIRGADCNRQR
ncbi:hypothetical protein PENANT_c003G00531 [Penicillium antarcticum]|uniref:SET domain-containing protein n=1 Tax=Penicillium antarcticum TaxID=416450 RepID=A0A1V6QIT8_9EURO|nr:hypothetical protein PENANT_c003G00531 [Penicillium antarcticum]